MTGRKSEKGERVTSGTLSRRKGNCETKPKLLKKLKEMRRSFVLGAERERVGLFFGSKKTRSKPILSLRTYV
jgi:hypothetical protein